jgi:hypothetical protein
MDKASEVEFKSKDSGIPGFRAFDIPILQLRATAVKFTYCPRRRKLTCLASKLPEGRIVIKIAGMGNVIIFGNVVSAQGRSRRILVRSNAVRGDPERQFIGFGRG